MPHLFYRLDLQPYTWTRFSRVPGPIFSVLLACLGRNIQQDRIKGLYWEGDGFLLLYKRLENGAFQWPRNKDEVRQLTPQQYRWLMEGLKTEQPKANKAVSGLSIL